MSSKLACCFLIFTLACLVDADSQDEVVLPLENGCSITRPAANKTAPRVQWYTMPLPHLNCSSSNLTRFHVEGVVGDTKSITLSYNNLIELHVDDLEPFPNLTKLELKMNGLTRILPSYKSPPFVLKTVTYISITQNKLTTIPNEALKSFPDLNILLIYSNKITKIQNSDFRFTPKLQFLYIGPNPIAQFEDAWMTTMNLTGLGLRGCGLTKLSSHIKTMKSLLYLDFSQNKLTVLEADSFKGCPQLQWLEIGSNQITRVDPLAFRGAYNLRMIDLSDNLISFIPNGTFGNMGKERVDIDLYENPMMCDCKNAWLKTWYDQMLERDMATELRFKCAQPLRNHGKKSHQLHVSDFVCKENDEMWQDCNSVISTSSPVISTQPPNADNPSACPESCTCYDEKGNQYSTSGNKKSMPRLRGFRYLALTSLSVNCDGAKLTRIPVENMRSDIRTLVMSENNLQTVDMRQLKKFKDLTILDLKKNGIKKIISDESTVFHNLTVLNLRFNNITSITKMQMKSFPNLSVLALYHNKISSFPADLFKYNRKLNRLYLGPNPLKTFQPHFLRGLNLYSLSLRNMSLTKVPEEIRLLQNVSYLDLSDNKISALKNKTFSNCSSLTRLVLENNQISSVESNSFSGATNLRVILLSENKISYLSPGVFSNISQERLNVELWSNFLICDCKLKWLKTWIEKMEETDPTTDVRFVCSQPMAMHNKKSDQLCPDDFVCSSNSTESADVDSCPVCKAPTGQVALAVILTFICTALCCFIAWRCTFRRRYSELLQYAKQRDQTDYDEMAEM